MSCILPPPPDVRKVEMKVPQPLEVPDWALMDVPPEPTEFGVDVPASQQPRNMVKDKKVGKLIARPEINCSNTTLIGTHISVVFPEFHHQWLVQASGSATFQLVTELIKQEAIAVDRKYIFVELGATQLIFADKDKMYKWVLDLVVAIRELNSESRIFMVGILPSTN